MKAFSLNRLRNIATVLMLLTVSYASAQERITIDLAKRGADVRPSMYGIFIEDINRAGDGGLYAEMVMNRSFEDLTLPEGFTAHDSILVSPPTLNHITGLVQSVENRWTTEAVPGWRLVSDDVDAVAMNICDENPMFTTAPHYLKLTVNRFVKELHLHNTGYGGYCIHEGATYHLRIIARVDKVWGKKALTARLISNDGTTLAETILPMSKVGKWIDQSITLKAVSGSNDAHLEICANNIKSGALCLDYVSLMPEDTYYHRQNGMRRDVAETIAAMHPAFVRWPGGCVVEGITLNTRFQWKQALGDPAARPGIYNLWGYRNSCGVGWPEMLQFCEDLGADAMYVCNVGIACQGQTSELLPIEKTQEYIDDCLDAIEYAIGDTTTKWGKRRADDGHPVPYPLRYVELGNENWGAEYDKRYNMFYKAVHEKYPQLMLICNYGIDGTHGCEEVQMVDPHWYVAPQFFYNSTLLFDSLSCKQNGKPYGVYVGEYACNQSVGSGNLDAALAEASFLTGAERNSDRVWMLSYAPLLESNWYRAWPTNLIWVSPSQVMHRSSYYVQQMMAENRPTYNIYCSKTASKPEAMKYNTGRIGFGCWKSKVDFRDAVITLPDGTSHPLDLSKGNGFAGSWNTDANGVLHQTAIVPRCKYMLTDIPGDTYTLELYTRKTAGKDAFLFYFGMDSDAQEGFYWSIGGQNNSKACVERIHLGENSGQDGDITAFHAETNHWYKLRIEVRPDGSSLYVDNKLLLEHHPLTSVQHAYAAGYDETTHEIILKAVNANSNPYDIEYTINNTSSSASVASTKTLSGPSLLSENSFKNPCLIRPNEGKCVVYGNKLSYTLSPYSLTIFRIKNNNLK